MKLNSAARPGLLAMACRQAQQTQGVSKNEIVVGSIQDLSGPLAALGKQVRLRHACCAWTSSTSKAASMAARSSC
jgi:ABC-type branched-subunit amino acid transport system substrate-binding protein